MKYKLLIVDDELPNLRLLERLFSADYQCLTASSGAQAISLLEQHDVAILITDQRMPEMTGIELLKRTAELRPHMVRILLTGYTDVEALIEAINCGLVYMYFAKPWNNDDLKLKVSRAGEHYENNKKRNSLVLTNERLLMGLKDMKTSVVNSLTDMLKTRNAHGYGHALRVRNHAMAIAKKVGLSDEEKEELSMAALLHHLGHLDDSGKESLRASCAAVNETSVARSHYECEARLLAAIPELGHVADLIRFYRESFDGTAAAGLKGERIPLSCRILRVADDYDLMILPKDSLAPMRHDEVMKFLLPRSGKQFDPDIIQIMSQIQADDLLYAETDASITEEKVIASSAPFEPGYVDAVFS